jgi:hypothetical protein
MEGGISTGGGCVHDDDTDQPTTDSWPPIKVNLMQLQELVREVRMARNELRAIKKILRQELHEEQLMGYGEQPAPVTALYKEDGLLILRVVFEPGRTTVPQIIVLGP